MSMIVKVLAFRYFGRYHGSGSIKTIERLYRSYNNGYQLTFELSKLILNSYRRGEGHMNYDSLKWVAS